MNDKLIVTIFIFEVIFIARTHSGLFFLFIKDNIHFIDQLSAKDSHEEWWVKDTKGKLLNLLKNIDKNHDSLIDHFELETWISNNVKYIIHCK